MLGPKKENKQRYPLVDQIRGFAVFLMIIFHFFYDLALYRYVNIDFIRNPFWYAFPRVIVFLFLFAVGISLCLVHLPHMRWKPFWQRWSLIVFFAVIISLSTYFFFPSRWIYFGTLHCIALTSLMGLAFLRFPKVSLFIGIALLLPALIWGVTIPWIKLPHFSMDYIAPFPWFGVVCLGIFAYHQKLHTYQLPSWKIFKGLAFLGRHSLVIYLTHQLVLYGLISLYSN